MACIVVQRDPSGASVALLMDEVFPDRSAALAALSEDIAAGHITPGGEVLVVDLETAVPVLVVGATLPAPVEPPPATVAETVPLPVESSDQDAGEPLPAAPEPEAEADEAALEVPEAEAVDTAETGDDVADTSDVDEPDEIRDADAPVEGVAEAEAVASPEPDVSQEPADSPEPDDVESLRAELEALAAPRESESTSGLADALKRAASSLESQGVVAPASISAEPGLEDEPDSPADGGDEPGAGAPSGEWPWANIEAYPGEKPLAAEPGEDAPYDEAAVDASALIVTDTADGEDAFIPKPVIMGDYDTLSPADGAAPDDSGPGYEAAGDLDLEAYTCDDCVYSNTCPKVGQSTPAECGSFQWKSS
ncbi:MAG: hypothetical protein JXP37_00050 [Coriobacteriia bacterium]|nr:hypothetical protein [Coriobacteriia bacterium]